MGTGSIHNGGSSGGGGGISSFVFSGSARFYQYTNNRWIGPSDNYGSLDQNFNQNWGTGVDPAPTSNSGGFGVFLGQSLKGLSFEADATSAQITAVNIALSHRASGALGTVSVLKKYTNQAISNSKVGGLQLYDNSLSIPFSANGQLFISVQPVGTLTATAYVRASFGLLVG